MSEGGSIELTVSSKTLHVQMVLVISDSEPWDTLLFRAGIIQGLFLNEQMNLYHADLPSMASVCQTKLEPNRSYSSESKFYSGTIAIGKKRPDIELGSTANSARKRGFMAQHGVGWGQWRENYKKGNLRDGGFW